ncbi:MAG: hypothetical protein ACLUWB_05475 [Parabacteroides distasonis]
MENKRFEHIITRYLKGKATPEEEAELLQAIHVSKEWEAAFRKRTAEWNPLEETEAGPEMESDRFDHHALGISIANRRGTGYFFGLNFFPKNMVLDSSGGLTIACIRSYRLFLESRRKSGNRKCRMANDYS